MLTLDINNPREHCNLACEFCYSWDLEGQLNLDDIKHIVCQNPGNTLVELGGGEPFLHPEISDIILYLTEKANVHIATNATHVPEQVYKLPPQTRDRMHIQVSLHASNSKRYGEITGRPHLFDRVITAIPKLGKHFPTSVNTVAYQQNVDDIPDIVGLIKRYALPHRINLALPIGRGRDVDLLSAEHIAELTAYLLAERMNNTLLDSPLLHANNCPALESAYGVPKQGACPAESGQKTYFSPHAVSRCEFLPPLVQLEKKRA